MGRSELVGVPSAIREDQENKRDKELAERAKMGDTEAFGELIQTHRDRAKRWAERMTQDSHMADDIVQDALVRAFLHVGTLADTSRFLPWFHRIVQNQANMRLRRGGPYKREQPIGGWQENEYGGVDRIQWDNLDSLLRHLTRMSAMSAAQKTDPAEQLLRKELFETIHVLLRSLNRRERGIFESYFFRQLSPDEIAQMYHTTTGSVHTYLHRSRRKLRQAHVRVMLGLPPEKGGVDMNQAHIVKLAEWPQTSSTLTTFVDRIGHMLASIGDQRGTQELMGESGFAFRMKISNKTTFADGIYVFDWRQTLKTIMKELGYEISILCGQLSEKPVPLLAASERFPVVLPIEEAILPFIRRYINMGKPVLYFDTMASSPHVHEWSLIYGYDDAKREVYVTDLMLPEGKTLNYDDLAENPLRFLAGIDGKTEKSVSGKRSAEDRAIEAIRFAIHYGRKGCNYWPMTDYLSYTSGLRAYDRWIKYMTDSGILPNRYGMGQLAAVYSEAKKYAALYLKSVPLKGEAMRLVLLASEAYVQTSEELERVSTLVPFIRSSSLLTTEVRTECASLLLQAKEFEAAAIGYLENAMSLIFGREQR
ncbi:RNA polymerase sigma factor [Paenibacillus lutimineralis]|nr:RNA polymerase sigma factor [Paenibacillus lutimineralis]